MPYKNIMLLVSRVQARTTPMDSIFSIIKYKPNATKKLNIRNIGNTLDR